MGITAEDIAARRADLSRQKVEAQATVYAVEGALQDLDYWDALLSERAERADEPPTPSARKAPKKEK